MLLLLLDAGSVGENENLDGFLEPVNLCDLVFNVELNLPVFMCDAKRSGGLCVALLYHRDV